MVLKSCLRHSEITLLFKVFTVTVSTFSDPRCERKISLPHDQAGGASYGEERVSDNGTKRGVHKNLPAVIFLTPLTGLCFSFRGGNVIFVSSVAGYQPMQVSEEFLLGRNSCGSVTESHQCGQDWLVASLHHIETQRWK